MAPIVSLLIRGEHCSMAPIISLLDIGRGCSRSGRGAGLLSLVMAQQRLLLSLCLAMRAALEDGGKQRWRSSGGGVVGGANGAGSVERMGGRAVWVCCMVRVRVGHAIGVGGREREGRMEMSHQGSGVLPHQRGRSLMLLGDMVRVRAIADSPVLLPCSTVSRVRSLDVNRECTVAPGVWMDVVKHPSSLYLASVSVKGGVIIHKLDIILLADLL